MRDSFRKSGSPRIPSPIRVHPRSPWFQRWGARGADGFWIANLPVEIQYHGMAPKTVVLALMSITRLWSSEPPASSTNLLAIDFDGKGFTDLVYNMSVLRELHDATVASACVPISGTVILASSGKDAFFQNNHEISRGSHEYVNPLDGLNRLPLGGYIARRDEDTLTWFYFSIGGGLGAGDRSEVIVGVRLRVGEANHYGWVRFTRLNTKPETLFVVAGYDWNPVPEAPIQAGLPPEIPVTSEVLTGSAGIRLTWPGGVSNWILESTVNLSAPIAWEVYRGTGGSYADVPPEDADRFFRLRRPD